MSSWHLSALVATEWLKLRTVRAPALLPVATVGVTLVLALQPVLGAGRQGRPSLGTVGAMLGVLDATGRGPLLTVVVGALVIAGEHHHATLATTLLQTPARTPVLVAKAVTAALVGLGLGLLGVVTTLAVGIPTGAVRSDLLNADIVWRVLGLLLAYPAYGLLGVGVGALVLRSQAAAVLVPVAWLLVMESLVVGSLDRHLLPWSLTGATAVLANAGDLPGVLPIWGGALLLAGVALLVLLAGVTRLARADIT
jgi:ABC-2 type transport system permease protein